MGSERDYDDWFGDDEVPERLWIGLTVDEATAIYESLRRTQHEVPEVLELLAAMRRFLGVGQ